MPIPKPKKTEDRKTYMQRCMSDAVMVKEYKNTDESLAVCAKVVRDEQRPS